MSHPDSLEAIAAAPPALSEGVIARHVNEHYGLTGELSLLVSERDQNFRLRSNDGNSYVVKIANRAEQQRVTEFQVSALAHLEDRRCPVAVPRVIRAADGSLLTQIADGPDLLNLRVVSWLAGRPLDGDVPGEALAGGVGFDVDDDMVPDVTFSIPALPADARYNVLAVNEAGGSPVFLTAHLPDGTTARIDAN